MTQKETKTTTLKEKQAIFIQSYIDNMGHITKACEDSGIVRATYYRWLKKAKFKKAYDNALEEHNDLIFQRILKIAMESDKDMLKFWARTQMKHRGFVEKQQIEIEGSIALLTKEEREKTIKRLLGK